MSSRLASFRGPSTPTSSPVQTRQQSSAPGSPSNPGRLAESTYHRKLRTSLQELRTCARTWDDLVMHDGRKALVTLIDARTELDNTLLLSSDQPQRRIVGPKIAEMEEHLEDLEVVTTKLRKQFQRMNTIVDGLDALLLDAVKTKGWKWVHEEPMWATWSLEKFVTSIAGILVPYHRALETHNKLVTELGSHSTAFEVARKITHQWVSQTPLAEDGWDAAWEDLCEVEIERWGQTR